MIEIVTHFIYFRVVSRLTDCVTLRGENRERRSKVTFALPRATLKPSVLPWSWWEFASSSRNCVQECPCLPCCLCGTCGTPPSFDLPWQEGRRLLTPQVKLPECISSLPYVSQCFGMVICCLLQLMHKEM